MIEFRNSKWKHERETLDFFEGRRIRAVWAPKSRGDVAFEFEDGDFAVADPEGDCCSYTWVEHISGVKDAYGAVIVTIDLQPELASQENVDESGFDVLTLYGITLITDRGIRIDIDYRNDSNGYYGGWLNWVKCEKLPRAYEWEMIHEDF